MFVLFVFHSNCVQLFSLIFTHFGFTTDVWIVGDSYVRRLHERACHRRIDNSLQQPHIRNINWMGYGGLRWGALRQKIQYAAIHGSAPKAIVIALGSNDLGLTKGCPLIHDMRRDLHAVQAMFPETKIIFSALLPRLVWLRTDIPVDKIETKRKQINRTVRRFVTNILHGSFVSHPDITADCPGMYHTDGVHLSDIGNDLFMLNIKEALEYI
ncbi:MAG: SGNH/GDSL hydrolase family protein [Sedimenticola sp.]